MADTTSARPASTGPGKKVEELQLAGPVPSGAGGEASAAMPVGGCLPRVKFQSPRLYFASLTPRTKANFGEEDYTEVREWVEEEKKKEEEEEEQGCVCRESASVCLWSLVLSVHSTHPPTHPLQQPLREMRGLFPEAVDSDMVPFIRVCK